MTHWFGKRSVSRRSQPRRRGGLGLVTLSLVATLGVAGCQTVSETFIPEASGPPELNNDSLFGSYLAARHAGLGRDVETAAAFYQRALENDPDNLLILERAFLLEVSSGNVDGALVLAEDLVQERPQNRIARLALGIEDLKASRYGEARQQFAEASGGLYNQLIVSLLESWSYAGSGQLAQAQQALQRFSTVASASSIDTYHEALIADYLGRPEQAETLFAQVLERDGQEDFRFVEAYGGFLQRAGRTADAIELYKTFLESAPRNPVITDRLAAVEAGRFPPTVAGTVSEGAAEAIFSIARLLAQERGVDLPMLYLQMALYLRSDHPPAQMVLADLHQRIDQWEEAAEIYAAIDEGSAYWRSAQIGLASSLEQLDQEPRAIRILERLLRQSPEDYEAAVSLGDLYRRKEDFPAAIEAYSRAIDAISDPSQEPWFLFYARGISYERDKQWDKAETDFFKALDLSPEQPLVLNYLAYSWIEQGRRLNEALDLLHKAVDQRPRDGYIVDSLGWAYFRVGDYEKAVEYLEQAVVLAPAEPVIHDHLGDAYWRVGRRIEARFQWRHALDLDPEEDQIELIQRKLDEGLDEEREQSITAGPGPEQG